MLVAIVTLGCSSGVGIGGMCPHKWGGWPPKIANRLQKSHPFEAALQSYSILETTVIAKRSFPALKQNVTTRAFIESQASTYYQRMREEQACSKLFFNFLRS